MVRQHPERLAPAHRMVSGRDYSAARQGGRAHRGAYCLLISLSVATEPTRVGFIASKKGVGGAVQRNRAKRRLREIVRRRWPRMPHQGYLLVFIASRATLSAPHQLLASEVESLLARAGALAPAVD